MVIIIFSKQTNDKIGYIGPESGTLLFRNSQLSDIGEYQCLVEALDEVNNTHVVNGSLASRQVLVQVLSKFNIILLGIYSILTIHFPDGLNCNKL